MVFPASVHVSSEETVAQICGVSVLLLLSQMKHRVGRSDEPGISGEVQVKGLTERLDPVMSPGSRDVRVSAAPPPAEVQPVRERLSEIIQAHRGDDLVRGQLSDEAL